MSILKVVNRDTNSYMAIEANNPQRGGSRCILRMENYQRAYGLDPVRDLPPTPTTYNSLPIHREEREPRPETNQTSQAESTSSSSSIGDYLVAVGKTRRRQRRG